MDKVFPKSRRKALAPAGITYGATVVGRGLDPKSWARRSITGQVWSRADASFQGGRRTPSWWVVTEDGTAYHCAERDLTLVGQITDDEQMELTA